MNFFYKSDIKPKEINQNTYGNSKQQIIFHWYLQLVELLLTPSQVVLWVLINSSCWKCNHCLSQSLAELNSLLFWLNFLRPIWVLFEDLVFWSVCMVNICPWDIWESTDPIHWTGIMAHKKKKKKFLAVLIRSLSGHGESYPISKSLFNMMFQFK